MRRTPTLDAHGAPITCLAVSLLLLLATSALARAECDRSFALDAEYFVFETGGRPVAVAAGDWDEDGRTDVAVLSASTGSISLLFGEGGFRMSHRGSVPVGPGSNWLISHDMNRDGHADLVVTGGLGSHVLAGDGRGAFQLSASSPVAGRSLAAGDLDGDGVADLMVAGDRIVSLLSRAGGFEERPLPGAEAGSVALGDLDGDTDLDAVVAARPTLLVLLNDGSAGFVARPITRREGITDGYIMESVALGDLNGDHVLDLVAVWDGRGDAALKLLGNGDGTFGTRWALGSGEQAAGPPDSPRSPVAREERPPHQDRFTPSGARHVWADPHYVTLADLDSDGRMNPIMLNHEPGLEVMGRRSIAHPTCAVAADIDGDGHLDVVVTGFYSGEIAVHPGRGDGSLRPNPQFGLGDEVPDLWRLADLDRDGINDLVFGFGPVRVAKGLASGGFGPLSRGVGAWPSPSGYFDLSDFDGDGVLDLISNDGDLHIGIGDGTFRSGTSALPRPVNGLAAGDLNGDGRPDVVTWSDLRGEPCGLHLGNGHGQFSSSLLTGVEPGVLALQELNGDGILDLVVGRSASGEFRLGVGDGTFRDPTPLPGLGSRIWFGMPFGDVDGDGSVDIATQGGIYLNRAGRFERRAGPSNEPPLLCDLNGDGRADHVVGNLSLVVRLSNGDGTFGPGFRYGPNGIPVAGDFNHDGAVDLLLLRQDDEDGFRNSATIMFNRTQQNRPPVITQARTDVTELWPPNHDMAPVRIVGVTDPDGDEVSIEVLSVTQDESVLENGKSGTCPDAIVDGESIQLRRERAADGSGRVYVVRFLATDECGASEEGSVSVQVPHDRSGAPSVDDGQRFSSLDGCGAQHASLAVEPTDDFRMARQADGSVELSYSLAAGADVRLDVFDIAGRRVATLESGFVEAGEHKRVWNLTSQASGLYYARLVAYGVVRTRSLLLVR